MVSNVNDVVHPHDHDVLSGRGNFVNCHVGNEYFRHLVRQNKLAYVACPKPLKGRFSRLIVDEIRSRDPPGRFLKQDDETKLWYDIGDKKALLKTRQALREGAPDIIVPGGDSSGTKAAAPHPLGVSKKQRRKETQVSREESLGSKLAIFGDSTWGLFGSIVLLLISIVVALSLNESDDTLLPSQLETKRPLQPPSTKSAKATKSYAKIYTDQSATDELVHAYQRDGVIAIRGLLSNELLDRLEIASMDIVTEKKLKQKMKRGGTQFFSVDVGVMLKNRDFLDAALKSSIINISASLLGLSGESKSLRVMRDILLTKDDDQYVCGWHTDDTGFWPATQESDGVNAWVALDDMPIEGGGGFALATGSHIASWRHEAHKVTGSTKTLPKQGFRDAADMFANRTGSGTCNIKTSAPHLNAFMEESMRVYEIRRGDVIFHDRWLFHRTIPFDKEFARQLGDPIYRRYSIRYSPGSAVVPPGYGLELSTLWNSDNAGRTADDVSRLDGPWYPKCWPSVDESELAQLDSLVAEKVTVAEKRRKERQKEMKPYLEKMRSKQGPTQ